MQDREVIFKRVQNTLGYIREATVSVDLRRVINELDEILEMMIADAEPAPSKMFRSVVQISTSEYGLFALCDDGSIHEYSGSKGWDEISGILMPEREST